MVTSACFGVIILALISAFDSYRMSAANAAQFPDSYGVSRAELRFASLLERVPATAQLGYLTDLDPTGGAYPAAFLATQYVLAPRELIALGKGSQPEWAIGNFSRPLDFAAAGAPHGYSLVTDYGNGVVLYRRNTAR